MFISEATIKRNQPSVLDTLAFMESDERFNSAALVPIVENTNRNGYMIDLNDIFTFAEAQNIEDLGYATSLICESSQINPNEVIFSIDETAIIADDTIASLVERMLSNGINVCAKPLSEDHPVSILGEAYLDHFFETGDMSLLESFLNGEDEILDESYRLAKTVRQKELLDKVAQRRKDAGDTRDVSEIKAEMVKKGDLMKHHAYWKSHDDKYWRETNLTGTWKEGGFRKEYNKLKNFGKSINDNGTAKTAQDLDIQKFEPQKHTIILPGKKEQARQEIIKPESHVTGGARKEKPVYNPDNTPSYKVPESAKKKEEAPKQSNSLSIISNSNNTQQNSSTSNNTKQNTSTSKSAQQDEEKIKNMADGSKWTNKPKEWYAAAIAWLHRKAKEFNDKLEKDGDNAPFWRKLIGYITRAIENLTAKKKAAA